MKAILCTLVCMLLLVTSVARAQETKRVTSLTGTIRRHEAVTSKFLPGAKNVHVYLPPNYESEPKRRFPVLYMHDGQNVFDGMTSFIPNGEWRADETAEALIRSRLIEPIIIVAIDNGGAERANEYLPTRVVESDGRAWGGKADDYAKLLIQEIKPMVDRQYRTKTGARDTALAGSSFGGIATLYLGTRHPDIFGKLGVFSPSLWWDNGVMEKQVAALKSKTARKIWVDIGTDEGDDAVVRVQRLGNTLEKSGYRLGKDLTVYVDGFAKHNEAAWASRFGAFLLFMFGE